MDGATNTEDFVEITPVEDGEENLARQPGHFE